MGAMIIVEGSDEEESLSIENDEESELKGEEGEKEKEIEEKDSMINNNEEDLSSSCSICFEKWTNEGAHRLCSLKCGHLFGKYCIDRWIATSKSSDSHSSSSRRSKCPQCNAPTKKSDVRILFAKELTVLDTRERDDLLKQLQIEKLNKRMALEAEARANISYQIVLTELERAKREIAIIKDRLSKYESMKVNPTREEQIFSNENACNYSSFNNFAKKHKFKVRGARTFDYDSQYDIFALSSVSLSPFERPYRTTSLNDRSCSEWNSYSSFGITKISLNSLGRSEETFSLHSQSIKDLSFSPHQPGILMTGSLDGKLKLSKIRDNASVLTFTLGTPIWSCTFDSHDPNILYAGLSNGHLSTFDIRNTRESISSIQIHSMPIHSLHSLRYQSEGRVLSASMKQMHCLNTTSLHGGEIPIKAKEEYKGTSIASMACDKDTVLVSLRQIPPSNPVIYSIGTLGINENIMTERTNNLAMENRTENPQHNDNDGNRNVEMLIGPEETEIERNDRREQELTDQTERIITVQDHLYNQWTHFGVSGMTVLTRPAICSFDDNNNHYYYLAFPDEKSSSISVNIVENNSFLCHYGMAKLIDPDEKNRSPILNVKFAKSSNHGRLMGCLTEDEFTVMMMKDSSKGSIDSLN